MSVRDGTIDELRAAVGLQIADEELLRTLVAGLDDVEAVLRGVASSDVVKHEYT